MKKFMLVLLMAGGAQLTAGKYRPIYTGKVEMTETYTAKQVKTSIKKALVSRGWRVKDASKAGVIEAGIEVRSHTAAVRITYDTKLVTISYVSSTNLGYKEKKKKGKVIHRNYNNWIKNLERDIRVYLLEFDE